MMPTHTPTCCDGYLVESNGERNDQRRVVNQSVTDSLCVYGRRSLDDLLPALLNFIFSPWRKLVAISSGK